MRLLILCLSLLCFSSNLFAQEAPVTLYIDMQSNGDDGNPPKGKLYVTYETAKVFVADVHESPSNLYEHYKMRPNELDKKQTWFAGGTVYSLKYTPGKVIVIREYISDEDASLVMKKIIKTIPLSLLAKDTKKLETTIKMYLKK